MKSVRIPEEDAYYRVHNMCVFSRIQKYNPGCVLQRSLFGALSDVTVVLGMRQKYLSLSCICHIMSHAGLVGSLLALSPALHR